MLAWNMISSSYNQMFQSYRCECFQAFKVTTESFFLYLYTDDGQVIKHSAALASHLSSPFWVEIKICFSLHWGRELGVLTRRNIWFHYQLTAVWQCRGR